MAPATKKWIRRAFAITLVLALCPLVWMVYTAITLSDHAERALHAINLATAIVDKYVERERRWPNSWDDLTTVKRDNSRGMYSWPSDVDKIKELVEIDFHADLRELAKQNVEEFDAIKPIGAFYPYKQDGYVESLVETLKKTTSGERGFAH